MQLARMTWFVLPLLTGLGCAAKQKPVEWMPPPRVDWGDISTVSLPEVHDGHVTLRSGPTQGLFPAALAVSRVSRETDQEVTDAPSEPRLALYPRNEFLQFNSAFDDLLAVSEVFPIAQRTLGGGPAVPPQILAAFRGLHSRLGLIYAVNELSPRETEVIAVLYEVQNGQPLVCYHARAESKTTPEEEQKEKTRNQSVDLWETDSRALARDKFQRMVHVSLRELILKDEPAPLEDKSGWTPLVPFRSAEWPPTKPEKEAGGNR